MLKSQLRLKNLVFYTSFGFAIIGFIATYLIAANTILNLNKDAEVNQYELVAETFLEHISQDLLFGINHEVIRKSKSLLEKESISSIKIENAEGKVIYQHSKRKKDNLTKRKIIYYDELKTKPAFYVDFEFKKQKLNFLSTQLVPLTTVLILLLLTAYFISRFVKLQIVSPLLKISTELERGDLNKISDISQQIENNSINEIQKLTNGLTTMARETIKAQTELVEKTREAALSKMASQLAHDIRSPLGAIDILTETLKKRQLKSNEINLLKTAALSINNIANDLLTYRKNTTDNETVYMQELSIYELIEEVIAEKSISMKQVNFNFSAENNLDAYKSFSSIQTTCLKRIFSNTFNNAFEAKQEETLEITIKSNIISKNLLKVEVSDNGIGIPSNVLEKLNYQSFTYNKPSGNGLGIRYAQEILRKNNGEIVVHSQLNQGTSIELHIPLGEKPVWFTSQIDFQSKKNIVLIDDDLSEYGFWRQKFVADNKYSLHYFNNRKKFEHEAEKFNNNDTLYLLDLNANDTDRMGFELIEKYGFKDSALIVTSLGNDPKVRSECVEYNVKVVDKQSLKKGLVSISI
ncbi:MAG: HAMP domain-containing histidine kinase [Bdellovibrionales bacterium]|nr:HAMP domain-containing histidine kinase [Bdellovibrionales bacterium]